MEITYNDSFGYSPLVDSSRIVREFTIGSFSARLLTDIKSQGNIEYTHILMVTDADENPAIYVAAEVNGTSFGGDSHFLGVFDGDGHGNYGCDDKWGDLETFAAEGVNIVKNHFGITE